MLRKTIAAIADFAFILGVEPPRQEIASQMSECFSSSFKEPYYNSVQGILNNQQKRTVYSQFNTVYLLANADKKAWLLIEEYLKDFAKPASQLNNGEGWIEKFYISARKYIVPAKVNIKLEKMGYSAWIPFGFTKEFPTFEEAIEEVRRRLKDSDLPDLKITFKRERIEK